MSSESLSQNEIDALLGSASSGAAPAGEPDVATTRGGTAGGESQVYDFRRPHRISKEKLRSLEAVYERFAKSVEGWLLGRVRGGVQLQLQSVEHFSFGEFTLSLPTPCASYTFEIGETGQHGVIDFGHEFAYFLVDRLFGGSGTPAVPGRSLTPIERMAVRVVAERMLGVLSEVWSDWLKLDLELVGFESIPEILRVANREDPMLVASVEVTAAETSSLVLVCLPFAVLEDFFAHGNESRVATQGSPVERDANRQLAEHSLRGARTWVSARLPTFQLSMRDLLGLSVGGVLQTGIQRTAELDVFVGSQRRFRASPGRMGPSLAVRLTDGLQSAPEADAIPLTRLKP
ncbi:MAG: FliM/FliN family flagellar motor switch protein [Gemmatimonadaceae bacterium]|nr:FliM/FliN family flagellar motor switch protein [Gemmatimonadaceae bacterium]